MRWRRHSGLGFAVNASLRFDAGSEVGGRVLPDASDLIVWELGEAASPYLNKGTASSANLTQSGAAVYPQQTDPWGGTMALGFGEDGVGARDYIAGANDFRPAYPITISFWVYPYDWNTTYTQHIVSKQHTTGVWTSPWTSISLNNYKYVADWRDWESKLTGVTGGTALLTGGNRIPAYTWSHIGVTYDGAAYKVYKNGEEVYNGAASGAITYITGATSGPWFMGAIPSGSGAAEAFSGRMSDVRIASVIRDATWFANVWATKEWDFANLGGQFFWMDLDGVGLVTKNTQPTPDDWDMEAPGAWPAYAGTSLKDAVDYYEGAQSNSIERAGSTGGIYKNSTWVTGNRVVITLAHKNDSVGAPGIGSFAYGDMVTLPASATWTVTTAEATTTSTAVVLSNPATGGKAWFDDLQIINLSVKSVTTRGILGPVAQAAAANMPWLSHASAPTSVQLNGRDVLYFDGVADYLASAWAAVNFPFHYAAGFTCSFVFYSTNSGVGVYNCFVSTAGDALATRHGIGIYQDVANEQMLIRVCNGSGVYVVDKSSGASTATNNAWHVVTMSWSESGGLRLLIDSAAAITQASVGSASASAPYNALEIGRRPSTNYHKGALTNLYLRIGAVSNANLDLIHAAQKARYAL